ncbi:thiazolylpeptide-type bacteriocin [Pseudonocardia sp.]|uniref:thiazolylpeptide-type bacteriocin n=1 Tax=Pseudonocardia sp. TaxID=60912 RepID=UPI00261D7463|nr:thiazolylpeptide-type bacteriocin [Pseudonocardia sp.]
MVAQTLVGDLRELESETFEIADIAELTDDFAGTCSTSCCSCSTSSTCACSSSCGSSSSTTSCSTGSTSSCT